MMKALIIIGVLMMASACSTVPKTVVTERKVPIPVMCNETVVKPLFTFDLTPESASIEEKVEALLKTDYEHRSFEAALAAGFVKCGGTVTNP